MSFWWIIGLLVVWSWYNSYEEVKGKKGGSDNSPKRNFPDKTSNSSFDDVNPTSFNDSNDDF